MDLPKRSQIKKYRPQLSESRPEHELNHQLLKLGLRGEKQHPVGPYFADIAFPEAMLAIEYDGVEYHRDRAEQDQERDNYFVHLGWKVIRINRLMDLAECAKFIRAEVMDRDSSMRLAYSSERRSNQGFKKI